ncbi:uncharacterized protein [Centruroides vittatus]|uniref:uncharacterized protein n=1 Tax=Centruroides vittatus TaxID=120091 RepID=UPI00351094C4
MDLRSYLVKENLVWLVAFRNPKETWQTHWSYLIIEILFYICGFLTLKHAFKRGGKNSYLWIAALLHGIVVESLSYFLTDIDNFWHAQSSIMFLGYRLPLYMILYYPTFIYTAYVAVNRLKLPYWAEPFALGLLVLILDVPFEILGVKCLWWTWHDTDPNIYDRHYWVPWTNYYFQASFVSSFSLVFRFTRCLISENEKHRIIRILKEILCVILTALFASPLGVIQFMLLYHSLHDLFKIHSEICVLLLVSLYLIIVWTADRNPSANARSEKGNQSDEVSAVISLLYITLATIVTVVKPEMQSSTGLHEPIGPCNEQIDVRTPFGIILKKRKYLCLENYNEPYYDFHCVKEQRPLEDDKWYTICGTPFLNHVEYLIVIWTFCLLGLYIYYQLLFKSGFDGYKPKTKKIKIQ